MSSQTCLFQTWLFAISTWRLFCAVLRFCESLPFLLVRFSGFSTLFSAIAMFLDPQTDLLKMLRSLRKARKCQKSSLISKEKVTKVCIHSFALICICLRPTALRTTAFGNFNFRTSKPRNRGGQGDSEFRVLVELSDPSKVPPPSRDR